MTAIISVGIVTVSDRASRGDYEDLGGPAIEEWIGNAITNDWQPVKRVIPDEQDQIEQALRELCDDEGCHLVVTTGGTGVAPRDVTPDTIEPELERVIPGFGELFRMLSYEDIGSAALLSRAVAGLREGKVVFAIPGSRGAVKLALDKLIVPELGHLAGEAIKAR